MSEEKEDQKWTSIALCGNDDTADVWATEKKISTKVVQKLDDLAKIGEFREILETQLPLTVVYWDGTNWIKVESPEELPAGDIIIQAFQDVEVKSEFTAPDSFEKDGEDWKTQLTEEEFKVLREKGTDPAGVGEYVDDLPQTGYFKCRACSNPLYSAAAKFQSGCGWPAFDKCYKGAVLVQKDISYGMTRLEIICGKCGGHMGHVFEGEHATDTNERHCVNSTSIRFDKGMPPEGLTEQKLLL